MLTCDKSGYWMVQETANIVDNLPDLKKNISGDVLMLLVYVAGYFIKIHETIDDLFFYISHFGRYLQEINLGILKMPGDLICQWVIYCYVTFLQSASER